VSTGPDPLIEEFVDAGLEAAERDVLPRALDELADRLAAEPSALARIRLVADTECGTPPDMGGLCMACGRRLAEPVGHKPGCNPFDRVIQVAVRTSRLARLCWAAARGHV
jgi:hypothetical protein